MKNVIFKSAKGPKLRKDDLVQVIAGNDKGRSGKIIEVDPKRNRARVEGVRLQTHFQKKDQKNKTSGLQKIEGFVDISNLQFLTEGKLSRIGRKKDQSGKLTRYAKKTDKFI